MKTICRDNNKWVLYKIDFCLLREYIYMPYVCIYVCIQPYMCAKAKAMM